MKKNISLLLGLCLSIVGALGLNAQSKLYKAALPKRYVKPRLPRYVKPTMPDFLIVGVTKCGTTSLYKYMIQHPRILGANKKEVHFFDVNFGLGEKWYAQQFPQKLSSDMLIGEASPGYFWKPTCAQKIAAHCPKTKLIVMFRDPVKRVISEYFRHKRRGDPAPSFDHAIARRSTRGAYLGAGKYMKHLARWLAFYPATQIHIVILEDLAIDPAGELNKVFEFVGVEPFILDDYKVCNKGRNTDKEVIKPETIQWLKDFYAPHNKLLEKYLGRKLPW